jgi:hypothetical protein
MKVRWEIFLAINFMDWLVCFPGKPETMRLNRLARRLLAKMYFCLRFPCSLSLLPPPSKNPSVDCSDACGANDANSMDCPEMPKGARNANCLETFSTPLQYAHSQETGSAVVDVSIQDSNPQEGVSNGSNGKLRVP